MKRRTLTTTLIVFVVLLLAAVPATAASPTPFRGNWKGVDPVDESNLRLQFALESGSGGQVFQLTLYDDRCNACGDSHPPARGHGLGILTSENHIEAQIAWWSLDGGQTILGPLGVAYDYDPVAGTIVESFGGWYFATYSRTGGSP